MFEVLQSYFHVVMMKKIKPDLLPVITFITSHLRLLCTRSKSIWLCLFTALKDIYSHFILYKLNPLEEDEFVGYRNPVILHL